MKSFADYITEATEKGDCYQAAFRWLLDLDRGVTEEGAKVCHGMVSGQGPLEGKKFGHAWGEKNDNVYDYSNGKKLVVPKAVYYALGKIKKSEVFCYLPKEVMLKAVKAKHYGPWDMTGATVDVSSSSVAEGTRLKVIIDKAKDIGKKKLRIPRNILNKIIHITKELVP